MRKNIPFGQLAKADYNRSISRARVNDIKRHFHADQVNPVKVSYRDGKYWIIDGQHTSIVLFEMNGRDPRTPIPCEVIDGLTYEQEADLFYRINTSSKPLNTAETLNSLIEARDPDALRFRSVIEARGYTIGGGRNNSLNAITAALKIFNRDGGEDRLSDILMLTGTCWPDNPKGVHSEVVSGIDMFLTYHGNEYKVAQFVKNLSKTKPEHLLGDAGFLYKQRSEKAYTKTVCMYSCILKAYNAGLHNKIRFVEP